MSCNRIMKKLLSVFQTITKRERGLRFIMMNWNEANVLMSVALCSRKSDLSKKKKIRERERKKRYMIGQESEECFAPPSVSLVRRGNIHEARAQKKYICRSNITYGLFFGTERDTFHVSVFLCLLFVCRYSCYFLCRDVIFFAGIDFEILTCLYFFLEKGFH